MTEDNQLSSGSENITQSQLAEDGTAEIDERGNKLFIEKDVDVELNDVEEAADISLWGANSDSAVALVSDTDVQEVAKQLLSSKAPKITMEYRGIIYNLFGNYNREKDSDIESDPPNEYILENTMDMHKGFNQLISSIREFLQESFGTLEFATKEIQINFPDLELCVSEDNAYTKNITMNDIVSIFKILRENSFKRGESEVPSHIHTIISLSPRFVSKYNDLVELVDNNASFAHVKGFSNDQQHPLVLDGNENEPAKCPEVVLMSSSGGDESEELLEIEDEPVADRKD
ncbi:Rmr1p Ecym_6005 [Eremothecium cymbalariae DBVPG|uniref:Reduced meiotic recombination protein 1 n=1 Tax=Eremothecium cymbalariae (strain CBS 270.75 / DBVPG 7215 / KCTC 17166 / NRRL Y-17582) TaxID=931890 RepID=G8JUT4_ERECY|nr:hypothetical protein Ecym_6005 [Eremothecium cymbalariae DBVPG\